MTTILDLVKLRVRRWEHSRDMPSHVWDGGSALLPNCTTSCLWTLRKKCGCTCNWPTERK